MTGTQAFEAVYGSASHLMDSDTAEQIVRFVASDTDTQPAAGDGEATPLDDLVVEPALLSLVCRGLNESRKARRDRGESNRIDRGLLASTGAGVVDWELMGWSSLACIPCFLGIWVGQHIRLRLNEKAYAAWLYIFYLIIGSSFLIRAF